MTKSIIVAIDQNLGIGKDNTLLCHISDDLKRFKTITTGHTIIMGRNTWDSLPFKPLKDRENIIISSSITSAEGAIVVNNIENALTICQNKTAFIIGGDSIYRQMMPYADQLIVTHIDKTFDADTFFPTIDPNQWTISEESDLHYDEKSDLHYKYITYTRINEK